MLPLSMPFRTTRRCPPRGIEVGRIFYFGTKYSAGDGREGHGASGQEQEVHMGSYGVASR